MNTSPVLSRYRNYLSFHKPGQVARLLLINSCCRCACILRIKDTVNKSTSMRSVLLCAPLSRGTLLMVSCWSFASEATLWTVVKDGLCCRYVPPETPSTRPCSGEGIVGSNLGVKILTHFCIFNVVSFLNSRQIMAHEQIGLWFQIKF